MAAAKWPKCRDCNNKPAYWRYVDRASFAPVETLCEPCSVLAMLAGDSFGPHYKAWEPVEWWWWSKDGLVCKPDRDAKSTAKYGDW